MAIAELLLPEFDVEMAGTRKTLQRVPDDKLDWKAHEKSNSIRWVASHLADIPGWVVSSLSHDAWDINPPGGEPYRTVQLGSRQEMLELFDKNVVAARAKIAETTDAEFARPWSLLSAGETLMTLPKYNVIRSWVVNHSIHHRAYLCAYFRLIDIPVPALYGPSGDEQPETL